MDLLAVTEELAAQVDTIDGLRVFPYPPDSIQPPAALFDLPSEVEFDGTYGRGMDRITLPLAVLVARVGARTSHKAILPYMSGSGVQSIKQVVEAGTYDSFDTVRVMADNPPFVAYVVADVAYLAAVFHLDIAGTGA